MSPEMQDRLEWTIKQFPPNCHVMLTPTARQRFPNAIPFGQVTGHGREGTSLRIRQQGMRSPATWSSSYWLVDQEAEADRISYLAGANAWRAP